MEFLIPALRSHKIIRQPASLEINFSGNFPEKPSGKLGPALQVREVPLPNAALRSKYDMAIQA
ncbi:MAG: hypothetical protein V3T65_00680 [Acidobacteriota bacterium]